MSAQPRRTGPGPERMPGERTSSEPLAGVHSPLVTAATRRVARKLHDARAVDTDPEAIASLLAAIALALDRHRPDFIATLLPRPSPQLGQRLVEMLRAELLATWTNGRSRVPAAVILDALARLEHMRPALERGGSAQLGEGLTALDPLELFAEVVHDLRSPLTAILFLADTLQRGRSGVVNQVQQRQCALIYGAALGLTGLVSDALELARGSDELADNEPSPLSLTELLTSVADIARPMAEEKGLVIRVTPAEPDARLGQPVALSRVLLNLTTNALKFTEAGLVAISCASRGTSRVEFSVRDTGPGISPEALAHLYQPFRRARGRNGYCFSRTGLGLAISRKLVAAMGGDLRFKTSSQGTRFFFELALPVLPRP